MNRSRASWVKFLAVIAGMGGLHHGAQGFDYWLEPDTVGTAKTEERVLRLRTGEAFKAEDERPLLRERTSRFDLYADQMRRRDLLAAGQEGQKPVARLPPTPGACLVVMDGRERQSTMEAEPFNRYLTEEGQDQVLALRAKAGQSGQEGREVHSRYLKTLVPGQDGSGTLPNTLYKRRVGQKLEILLQNDPWRLPANRKLTVKVLFEGEPLAGAKVFAYRHEAGGAQTTQQGRTATMPNGAGAAANTPTGGGALTAVTSAEGLAEFRLDQAGSWLVRLVHVVPGAERRNNSNGLWESFWGSYSFVAKDAPMVAPVPPAGKE